jgi:epoxyqueuosine reductase
MSVRYRKMADISILNHLLEPHGLLVLGAFNEPDSTEDSCRILVGNTGSAMWLKFRNSPEFSDGASNPLDRWTRRIGESLAKELNAPIVFPFDGPPYPPFLAWAKTTGQAFPSPLSMFIHQQFGLWHAYRFALQLPAPVNGMQVLPDRVSPCLSCTAQPCLDACPVDAFSTGSYRVDDCMAFLVKNEKGDCREKGCRARGACPAIPENQYQPEHARFHMDAFVRSKIP